MPCIEVMSLLFPGYVLWYVVLSLTVVDVLFILPFSLAFSDWQILFKQCKVSIFKSHFEHFNFNLEHYGLCFSSDAKP